MSGTTPRGSPKGQRYPRVRVFHVGGCDRPLTPISNANPRQGVRVQRDLVVGHPVDVLDNASIYSHCLSIRRSRRPDLQKKSVVKGEIEEIKEE